MRIRPFAAPAVLAAGVMLGPPADTARPQPPALVPPRPVDTPRPPLVVTDFGTYHGRVVALDHRSITVQGINWGVRGEGLAGQSAEDRQHDFRHHQITHQGNSLVVYLPGRTLISRLGVFTRERIVLTDADGRETVIRREDEPRFRFPLSQPLATGEVGNSFAYRNSPAYRAADVRVGDEVEVGTDTEDGRKVCAWISIERRPGGRVPPAAREDVSDRFPRHHERMNALQDWEDAGVPLTGRVREMYAHLLPEEPAVAPPPRELPPRIPATEP